MRYRFLLVLLLVVSAVIAMAQTIYVEKNALPGLSFLPGPPDTTSVDYECDVYHYQAGKLERDTPRGEQAVIDGRYSVKHVCANFSEAFGLEISETGTPAIYKVLNNALSTAALGCDRIKYVYRRPRPYQYFQEQSGSGEVDTQFAYPSGHTIRGWLTALLLTEINPGAQDALLKRGFDYGESRVIMGAHWKSDVEDGRMVASTYYARLHAEQAFLNDMQAARWEYMVLTAEDVVTEISEYPSSKSTVEESYYTIDGRPATPNTRGIIVSRSGKRIVP